MRNNLCLGEIALAISNPCGKKKGDFKGACPLRREGRAQRSATAGGDFPLPVYLPNKSECVPVRVSSRMSRLSFF